MRNNSNGLLCDGHKIFVKGEISQMMKCPKCGYKDTICVQSTESTNNRIRRRKHCGHCGYRFTTYEVYEGNITEDSFTPGKRGPKPKKEK